MNGHVSPGTSAAQGDGERFTYLIVDGENIDATLGLSILGRRPNPGERPRWDAVRDFAARAWGQPVRGLFFLNATSGSLPMGFVQALLAMGYRPIPLAGTAAEKVVDIGIQRTLQALRERRGDVILASHDGDFRDDIAELLGNDHRVAVLGFREFVNAGFASMASRGLTVFDLEDDADAFQEALPRVRIIPLESFDPLRYL